MVLCVVSGEWIFCFFNRRGREVEKNKCAIGALAKKIGSMLKLLVSELFYHSL